MIKAFLDRNAQSIFIHGWTNKRMDEGLPSCCINEHMGHGSKIKIGKAIKWNVRVQVEEPSSSSLTYNVTYTMSHYLYASTWIKSVRHASIKSVGLQVRTAGLEIKLASNWHNIWQITISTEIIAKVILVPYRLLLEWHGNLTLKMQSIRVYIQYNYLKAFSYICFP